MTKLDVPRKGDDMEDKDDSASTPLPTHPSSTEGGGLLPRAGAHPDNRQLLETQPNDAALVHGESDSTAKLDTTLTAELGGQGKDFEPCTFFFYGTLMDPEVLMPVATLNDAPQYQDAWIDGFTMKMWSGIYPVLLPSEETGPQNRIHGKIWQATTVAQYNQLQEYETSAYEPVDCQIQCADGRSVNGLVFTWAWDPDSEELVEGTFDLKNWQKGQETSLY